MANLGNTIINGILRVNGKLSVSGDITASSFTGNLTGNATTATTATSATKATQDKNGLQIDTGYLKLSGGTMTGKLTANGKIAVPTVGQSWIDGKTITNSPIQINTQQMADHYHPILAVKSSSGHVLNFGGLGDYVGFYGYDKNTTDNKTDYKFFINMNTGKWSSSNNIIAPTFEGALSGNATSATSATKATQDSDGNTINTTYFKKSGGNITGEVIFDKVHRDEWYASNVCRMQTPQSPTESVIYTKIRFASGQHMPVVRIYGYAYGLQSPIELKLGFYIYDQQLGWAGVVNMGAWKPQVYLFKYTQDSVDYVAIGFKGSCYCLGYQVDVQIGSYGNFGSYLKTSGWTISHNGADTTQTLIPAVGTDGCVAVGYKDIQTNIGGNAASSTYANNSIVTLDNPSSGTWYYPTWVSGLTSGGKYGHRVNDGLRYYSLQGTTSAAGRSIMSIGNAIATGTAENKYGEVRIYAEKAGFATLKATASATTEAVHTFPTTGGTLLNTGTTSFTQTVTAGTKIGAIKINGTSQDILIPTSIETANKAKLLDNLYTSATRPTSANVPITGSGGLATFKATGDMTTGKPTSDAHILHMYWDNTGGHDSQLAVLNGNSPMIQLRGQSATTWGDWITVPRSTDNSTNNIVAMSTADYNSVKDSLPNGSLVAVW